MYEVLHHTADLRLKIRAASIEELFRDAMRGMTESLQPAGIDPASRSRRTASLEAVDRTTLLIDFLNEVLWYAHGYREVFDDVCFSKLTDRKLEAELAGKRAEGFGEDIKAVTYHEAEVRQNHSGEWETTVVFDI